MNKSDWEMRAQMEAQENAELKDRIAALEAEIQLHKQTIGMCETSIKELEADLLKALQDQGDLAGVNQKLEGALATVTMGRDHLKAELAKLNESYTRANLACGSAAKERDALAARCARLDGTLKDVQFIATKGSAKIWPREALAACVDVIKQALKPGGGEGEN